MIKLKDILNESDVFGNTSNTSTANGAEAEFEVGEVDTSAFIEKMEKDYEKLKEDIRSKFSG